MNIKVNINEGYVFSKENYHSIFHVCIVGLGSFHWTVVGKNWKVLSRIGFVEKFVKCMVNSVKAHE